MSSQNNMAKESYPYKIIESSYAPSSSHKDVPNFYTPDDKPSNCFILKQSQTFSTFTQYMSARHGHSTMGGIEYDDGDCVEKTKRRKSHINEANQ